MILTFCNDASTLLTLVLQLRGGKSKASSRKKSSTAAAKKRAVVKDEEDDDDNDYDDEEEEDNRSSRRKTSRKSGKGGRGRKGGRGSSLVQYGGKGSKSKAAGLLAGLVSQSREKLEELTKQSQSAYKDVYRRAKVPSALWYNSFFHFVVELVMLTTN